MMTLKFSQNTKVTRALAGRCLLRPAADDVFEIHSLPRVAFILRQIANMASVTNASSTKDTKSVFRNSVGCKHFALYR